MNGKSLKKWISFFLCLALMAGACSCKGLEMENKAEEVEEYTKSEAMIFLANERNRYQNSYTGKVWQVKTDEDETFDKLMIRNVKDFLEEVKLLNMLAEERGVQLTSQEREYVRQMTDIYYGGLSEADLSFIGCTREDVQKMYTQYYTACKMTDIVTNSAGSDISDSEAKVIRIMQIGTEDVKKAKAILKRIKIDGAGFNSMASRYSELDQIEVELRRGEKNDLIENTAFHLEEGQVSNILFENGMYYIIRCTNGYDEAATKQRKDRILTAMQSLKYNEVMDPYRAQHNIVFFDRFWNEVNFRNGEGSTAENFFDVYHANKGE